MSIEQFKAWTWGNMEIARGKVTDFPPEFALFVKRDMFGDSGFPNYIFPNNKEGFLALVAELQLRGEYARVLGAFELRVSPYHGDLIVEVYYEDKSQGHWVIGFIRYGAIDGIDIPFSMNMSVDDMPALIAGYSKKTIREANPEAHGDNPLILWSKDDILEMGERD